MRKKIIATLLAVVLLLGLIPLTSIGGGVAYAAPSYPRATAIDATKIDLGHGITVTAAQLIPGTPTTEEVPDMGTYYNNSGTINIYVDAIPNDVTELTWSQDSIAAALTVNWGSYAGEEYTKGFTQEGITVSADDNWKAKNHECFFAYDNETFLGPTCLYDVAIMLTPPRATAIDATKITFDNSDVKVAYAQLIPGTPTATDGDYGTIYKNSGKINIYVDAIPDDVTTLTCELAEALEVEWGSFADTAVYVDHVFNLVELSSADGWRAADFECFYAGDAEGNGPSAAYDVAIYEGACPPQATAIDATKITFANSDVKVTYAQLIPGTPTTEEVPDVGTYYNNSGTINIYVDAIPDDVTELTWSSDSIAAALTVDWGSYAGEEYAQEFTENGITVSAGDNWKVKNHECFFAYDNESFLGPTCLYDVAIYEGGVREQGVVLSDGVASRTSDTTAEITFSASEAGTYVWAWADAGTVPAKPTEMQPAEMTAGTNSFTVNDLTAGAKKLRVWASDSSGNSAADPLDINIYAYTSAEWPQLTSFTFPNGTWTANGITLTDDNISVNQYETLTPYSAGDATKFYAGEVIIRCEENVSAPNISPALQDWQASAAVPAGFSDLSVSSGMIYPGKNGIVSVSAKRDGVTYTYYYTVKVSCDGLIYSVPDEWKSGEAGQYTFSPGKYLSNYANWSLTAVTCTWGTTSDKDTLNFTSGSDTFTLTNGEGHSQKYTVTLDMPWQFVILPQKGYDLSALSADGRSLSGYEDLSTPSNRVTKHINKGQTVTISIKPTGENKNKVIDTVTLKSLDGITTFSANDVPITISGNTFSFTMPGTNVMVDSVAFKEDTSPRYSIFTSTTKYRNESDIYAMGSVTITDGENPIGDAHAGNEVTAAAASAEHGAYTFQFDRWEAEGFTLTEEQQTSATITFEMPANEVSLKAVFKKVGAELTFEARPESALTRVELGNQIGVYMSLDFATEKKDIVKSGAKIIVRAAGKDQFVRESYTVTDQDSNTIEYTLDPLGGCVFTVPENATSVHVIADYRAKEFSEITTAANDAAMGSATATVNGTPISAAVTEGETVTLTATPKFRYKLDSWTAVYADGSAIDFELTSEAETPNIATFTVPANGKKINITANFVRDETQNSTECEMRSVGLYDGETKIGKLSKSSTNYTITVPADTDTSKLGEMLLKLTCSDYATITKSGDTEAKDWASGQPCGMVLNTPATFVVTAEDGTTTKTYTITIKMATAPDVPTLTNGSATRTSKTGATVKFTSNEAGTYFYKVVEHGAAAPTVDTGKNGTSAVQGENTITLSNLTEDARDIYIVVKNASGGESAALKVEIPTYGSSETPDTGKFTLTVTTPKGGTLTTNRTKANEGDEIIVTVKPDSGYQMVEGSLTYTLAVDGGETVKITGNRFTMPSCDVSITCKWETASVVSSGITGFSINGVAGTVNSTTNTITITMPRGTDVTKLTPAISTSGVKSLTPGSGETVNFTNSVTYTATMDDGSTRTYIVTVYVDKGTLADQFWDKLTDFYQQIPWWKYAEQQQSSSKYPKYW